MALRTKVSKAAVVAVLGASAIAYGALEKHVTVRIDDSLVRVRTFAGTVGEVLERADITLHANDRVRPAVTTPLREGMLIEVRRAKPITVILNGKKQEVIVTALTVGEVIEEMRLRGSLADYVGASRSDRVTPGMVLVYRKAVGIHVAHDGKTDRVITNAATVRDVLAELGVHVASTDQVSPSLDAVPNTGMLIRVLRVGTRVETANRKVPFRTVYKGDPFMERGRRALRRAGSSGLEEVRYRVTYEDGKVVTRKLLAARTLRNPVSRIIAVGTGPHCICTRGTQTGDGTWYGAQGLIAAHRTLPFGTVVRVTNLENGRTVTVTIRDRGPLGEGRIIDLSDDAFARIAGLGEGVVRVRIRW